MEVFIEGGRSRDGRITLPRLGILSFVVDAFLDGSMGKARHPTTLMFALGLGISRRIYTRPSDASPGHPVLCGGRLPGRLHGQGAAPRTLRAYALLGFETVRSKLVDVVSKMRCTGAGKLCRPS